MKQFLVSVTIILCFFSIGCSNVSSDAVDLTVDFNWDGFVPCAPGGNPELRISGIPDQTKVLEISLTDHGLSHGRQKVVYNGSGIIKMGVLVDIESPCPIGDPGKYKFKVKAIDADGTVIGVGSMTRHFPEKD